jgi:transglutaminase-like putative cysteine protease
VHWVDTDGRIVQTQEPFLDRLTMATTEQRATRPNDPLQTDLGLSAGVRIDPPISDPDEVNYAVYRLELDGMQPAEIIPTCLAQRVLPAESGVALVTVHQVTPDVPESVDVEVAGPTPADLASSTLVQSHHPRIRAIADSVAGTVDDPWLAAQLLEHHVHGRLAKTDYRWMFSSAAATAERRSGDCSEHAVLLAALCRARGIPARVAIGLRYSPPHQRFLYHMWNEVWIADRWIPLDATIGRGTVGGLQIKLRDSSLDRETPFELVTPVGYLLERLKIQVIATQPDP